MVRVYGCFNCHQLVPLILSRFVKTLGKGFGHLLFVHYVVLALGFHVASMQLEKGGDLHRFAGKLDETQCKLNVSLFYPWHGHASHAIVDLFAGKNEGAPGFSQSYGFNLGLLLHGHGKPISKILLASSRSGIFELGFFTRLGF